MTAAPRPNWLFRVALACVAMVCVLRAGSWMADRPLPLLPLSAHDMVPSRTLREFAARALAVHHDASSDHASTRPATTQPPAWPRSGRRAHRTASSPISTGERTLGMVGSAATHERGGLPATSRLAVFPRDGRRGSAPTRAPPNHR